MSTTSSHATGYTSHKRRARSHLGECCQLGVTLDLLGRARPHDDGLDGALLQAPRQTGAGHAHARRLARRRDGVDRLANISNDVVDQERLHNVLMYVSVGHCTKSELNTNGKQSFGT